MTPEEVHRVANERLDADDAAGSAGTRCHGAANACAGNRHDAAFATSACRGNSGSYQAGTLGYLACSIALLLQVSALPADLDRLRPNWVF